MKERVDGCTFSGNTGHGLQAFVWEAVEVHSEAERLKLK